MAVVTFFIATLCEDSESSTIYFVSLGAVN